jgi:hypothetical protein
VGERLTKTDARAAVAAESARLGTEYRLGECEWTQFDREYPPYRRLGLLIFSVSVVFVPVCVVAFVAPGSQAQTNFEFGLVFTPIIACMVIAGALMIWCPRPVRVDRTFWFSGGLMQFTLEDPEPRVIRWDDVISLSVQVYRPDEGEPSISSSMVSDQAGTSIRVRGTTYVSHLPRIGLASALVNKASQILVPTVVPAFLREFDAGQRVSFGNVWIDRSGISGARARGRPEPEFVAWPNVQKIDINARTAITIRAADRRLNPFIDLGNIPNGFFAPYLIDHAAAQVGFVVNYSGEKRMPARVATDGAGL